MTGDRVKFGFVSSDFERACGIEAVVEYRDDNTVLYRDIIIAGLCTKEFDKVKDHHFPKNLLFHVICDEEQIFIGHPSIVQNNLRVGEFTEKTDEEIRVFNDVFYDCVTIACKNDIEIRKDEIKNHYMSG